MSRTVPRTGVGFLVLAALMVAFQPAPAAEAADRQIRPFFGATLGGSTTFIDLEGAAGKAHPVVGVSAVRLGEVIGVEVDVANAPGFFQAGDTHLVLSSRVTTVTGNLIVAAPKRLTEYSLRPYVVGGAGLISVSKTDSFSVFQGDSLWGFDAGAGAVGALSTRFSVYWEVRRFQSLSKKTQATGNTFGDERISFWRASMGLAIRY